MNITVIGAGAMGSLFGGIMAESGHDVRLLDIWEEHVNAINENGLSIEYEGKTRNIPVKAFAGPDNIPESELVILFVKSPQTAEAAKTAPALISDKGFILTLQNGMGNADIIGDIAGKDRVIAGTTSHGATLLGPGRIRHAGVGKTIVGLWGGGDPKYVDHIVEAMSKAGITTIYDADIKKIIWEKLLVNVGINAITALTGIRNGQILDMEVTRKLSENAVMEAMKVAGALGIKVREDAAEYTLEIAEATAGNRSSMGQDVDNHRITEIAAINGAVVAAAGKLGISVPVNTTLMALVETLQAHYDS
jgi:2-dehydropantoate 2-reductase